MEYYSDIKKLILTICHDIDGLKGYCVSEISWTEKNKYRMLSFICVISKKKENKTKTLIETVTQGDYYQTRGWEMVEKEKGNEK